LVWLQEQTMPNAEPPGPSTTRHTQTAMLAERAAVLLLLALLLYGVIRVLEPFGLAIAFGGFIVIGTWPLRQAMVSRGIPRGIAATLMLLVLVLSVAIPALALTPELGGQIAHASKVGRELLAGLPEAAPAWLAGLPLVGGIASDWWPQLLHWQGDFGALLAPYTGRITSLLVDIGQAAAASVVQILLALIVATAFWVSGDKLGDQVTDIAGRLAGETGRNAVMAAEGAVRGVAWGIVGTGIIQAMLMGIGLAIAGVPGVGVISFLTLIFSISQILGPLVVVAWLGAAAWLYSEGQLAWAIFMGLWGLIMVSGSDNIVRPLLIKRSSEMPLSLIILGVFGGLIAFGFLGLFIGPALLAVAHGLLKAWRAEEAPTNP
jgi:predicted PurR-regulated permease PerM